MSDEIGNRRRLTVEELAAEIEEMLETGEELSPEDDLTWSNYPSEYTGMPDYE